MSGGEEAEGCGQANSYHRSSVPGGMQTVPETPKQFSNPGKMACSLGWHAHCAGCASRSVRATPAPQPKTPCVGHGISAVVRWRSPWRSSPSRCSFEFPGRLNPPLEPEAHLRDSDFMSLGKGLGIGIFPSSTVNSSAVTQPVRPCPTLHTHCFRVKEAEAHREDTQLGTQVSDPL